MPSLPLSLSSPPFACNSLLRDYFDAEFKTALAGRLSFPYDLERIVDDTLLEAIADGTFGLMKRPADQGRGLDGVVVKSVGYLNPVTEILEGQTA